MKTYVNEKNESVTAVMEGIELEAISHILKRLGIFNLLDENNGSEVFDAVIDLPFLSLDKADMHHRNAATVKCHGGDKFDVEKGKKLAMEKADRNFYRSMRKALTRWQVAIIKKVFIVSPDTFDDAIRKVQKYRENMKV